MPLKRRFRTFWSLDQLTKTTFTAVFACGPRFRVIGWTVPTLAGFSRIHNRISTGFP